MSLLTKKTKVKIVDRQGPLLRKAIGEVLVSQVVSQCKGQRILLSGPVLVLKKGIPFQRSVLPSVRKRTTNVCVGEKVVVELASGPEVEDQHSFLTTQAVIEMIEDGLSTVVFRELCNLLDISDKALAEVIKIPISTLAKRKKRGHFSSTESERIYRILNLYKQALDTFDGNEEYARKWLKEDAYGLGGVPPLGFAKTELGAKEVEQLLIRIDEGIFA